MTSKALTRAATSPYRRNDVLHKIAIRYSLEGTESILSYSTLSSLVNFKYQFICNDPGNF